MIVWSGWGILVAVFGAIGLFAGAFLGQVIPAAENVRMAAGMLIGGVLAGGMTLMFARFREKGPGRSYTDNQTGQRFEVRPNAGSLFFIPTRYWAYILPGLGLIMAWVSYSGT